MEEEKAIWVRGNKQPLLIPLEQETIRPEDEVVTEPYYPEGDATVNVYLVGRNRRYPFRPVVDGNLLTITEDGSVPAGCYGIEVTVINRDDTRFRSYWPEQVIVTESNPSVLEEWNEFKRMNIKAKSAVFFFAKGDKGDEGKPGGLLFPKFRFDLETGELIVSGLTCEVERISYNEETGELCIKI